MGERQISASTTGTVVTINGTLQTARLDGFSGSTTTAFSNANGLTLTLGTSSTIIYAAFNLINATGLLLEPNISYRSP